MADFSGPTVWTTETRAPAPGEVICHGDFGPHNLIWHDTDIVGVIDWEWAHPGPPIEDVAFAAWQSIPLRNDDGMYQVGFPIVPDRRERLQHLLSGYGRFETAEVIEAVLTMQDRSFRDMQTLGPQGIEPWKTYCEMGLPVRNRLDHAWLKDNGRILLT